MSECDHDYEFFDHDKWVCSKCGSRIDDVEFTCYLITSRKCSREILFILEHHSAQKVADLQPYYQDEVVYLSERDLLRRKAYGLIERYSECFQFVWDEMCDGDVFIHNVREIINRPLKPIVSSNSKKRTISNSKRKRIFERDKYRCLKCGTHKELSIDHIIPESKGGSSKDENLQTLCLTCNKSKGVKSNEEFMRA